MDSTKKRLRNPSSPFDAEPRSPPANGGVLPAEEPTGNHLQDRTATKSKSNPRRERVFSPEDETMLLQSLCDALENSASSFPIVKNSIDTPILTEIAGSLGPRFTQTQISDKLRGLSAKYVKLKRLKSTSSMSDHDVQIYELGRKIWGNAKDACPAPTTNHSESWIPGAEIAVETAPNGGFKRKKRDREKAKDKAKDAYPNPTNNGEANGEQSPGADMPVETSPNGVKHKRRDKERTASKSEECGFDVAKFPFLVEECGTVLELGNGMWRKVLKVLPEEKLREMNDKFAMVKCEEADVMSKKSQVVTELTRLILGAVAASQSPPA